MKAIDILMVQTEKRIKIVFCNFLLREFPTGSKHCQAAGSHNMLCTIACGTRQSTLDKDTMCSQALNILCSQVLNILYSHMLEKTDIIF
jgi:hypothetical protein